MYYIATRTAAISPRQIHFLLVPLCAIYKSIVFQAQKNSEGAEYGLESTGNNFTCGVAINTRAHGGPSQDRGCNEDCLRRLKE